MRTIEIEREDDERWIAKVVELPGVLAYGATCEEAIERVTAVTLSVIADRVEQGEAVPDACKDR